MRCLAVVLAGLLLHAALPAAEVAPLVLRGERIDIGIGSAGHLRSESASEPVGGVVRRAGAAASADYFPVLGRERWHLRWGTTLFSNPMTSGQAAIVASEHVSIGSGETLGSRWSGTATSPTVATEKLDVVQTIRFDRRTSTVNFTIVLTNSGSATLSGVSYMRRADVDVEGVETYDVVHAQPTGSGRPARPVGNGDRALIVATSTIRAFSLGLATIDGRATVAPVVLSNLDPDNVITVANALPDPPTADDRAIALNLRLGELAPGQSATFDFAYIFDDLDALARYRGGDGVVALPAPAIPVSGAGVTRYHALCPGTRQGLDRLRAALAGRPATQARAFTWDGTAQRFVEYPAEPAGGIQPHHAWYLATRRDLGLDFSGSSQPLPWLITLQPGWNFIGTPPGDYLGETRTAYPLAALQLLNASGTILTGPARTAVLADAAYSWDGSAYAPVTTLESGRGYWLANESSAMVMLRCPFGPAPLLAPPVMVMGKRALPPAPPSSSAPVDGGDSRCGSGSMLGLLVMVTALALGLRRSRMCG